MKNKMIENILIEEKQRLIGRLKTIEHRIMSLPEGWIRIIRKGNKIYKYLYKSKREGNNIKSIFLGKANDNIEKLINERRKLIKEKKRLQERIKELDKILKAYNG
ncbi:hypothetical protein [Hydrogenothermus marinus]|uniref:Uncharacterized protein n=1 Tax=Hydrogenothermus marinus TaxID=133270 RepID=A0A3M0BRD6_9AQUI|nr:hypothetical protein [Hydrogenothermus marinus]RMB00054.1 hypothetical protein CLV39_0048 [Hydrogenothermus marinus]